MKFIAFFINHRHLNHLLLFLLLLLGMHAYINIPKEMFPEINLNKILVSANYAGASAKTLDEVIVREIEESFESIVGIKESDTIIGPGAFSIILKLSDSVEQNRVLDEVKDGITGARAFLPSDMDEPRATIINRSKDLVHLSVASDKIGLSELKRISERIRGDILHQKNISEVLLQGIADERLEIALNAKAIIALGLDPAKVTSAIHSLSYTFPVGQINKEGAFFYISMAKGGQDIRRWAKSILKIDDKFIRLEEIATVALALPDEVTRSFVNGKQRVLLRISKDPDGNSMEMVEVLKQMVVDLEKKYPKLAFKLSHDSSKPLKERLDTIMANLFLGLILVFFTMRYLISTRTAMIVSFGVPVAFIIGLLFIYYGGYSLNLVSLIGALITVGIVVDDAIIVSENIQRHLDSGVEPKQAVLMG